MTQSSELKAFEHTMALTNEWLNQLDQRLGWENKQRTYRLLRETMHAIRDCLGVNEASHLASELPMLIRGLYYEGWEPSATPVADNKKDAFILRIDRAFKNDPLENSETAIRAIFDFLGEKISKGEIRDVRQSMSADLQKMWPA